MSPKPASSRPASTTRSSRWPTSVVHPSGNHSESVPAGPEQALLFSGDARCIAGQAVLPQLDIAAYGDSVPRIDDGKAIRSIAGQLMAPVTESEVSNPLDADDGALILSGARNLAGQVVVRQRRAGQCPATR